MMPELMVEKDIMTDQEFDLNVNSPADESVPDPSLSVDSVMSTVNDVLGKLQLLFGVDWQDFEVFLRAMEPDLDLTIDELWRRVDCEIYSQYLNREINIAHYTRWYNDLLKWQNVMVEAAHRFELWKRRLFVYMPDPGNNSNVERDEHTLQFNNFMNEVVT